MAVSGQVGRQELDGDRLEAGIGGLVDHAHAALTKLADNLIQPEGGAWRKWHGKGKYIAGPSLKTPPSEACACKLLRPLVHHACIRTEPRALVLGGREDEPSMSRGGVCGGRCHGADASVHDCAVDERASPDTVG